MRPDWRIDDFADRSFRDAADGDYIAARVCHRMQLDRQFLWLSHQAIEKYLKAILLYSRIDTRNLIHRLPAAFEKVLAIPEVPFDFDTRVHKFVEYLDMHGSTRYFEAPYYLAEDSLFSLDHTVWSIRLYCFQLKREIPQLDGPVLDLFEEEVARVKRWRDAGQPHKYRIQGGYLEKVLDDKKSARRAALVWKNPYYGSNKKHVLLNYSMRLSAENPAHFLEPGVYDELKNLVVFSKDVRDYFKGLQRERPEG